MAAMRKVVAMPRIFVAEAQPEVLYGAEIAQPSQEIIKELERTARMASLARPMATPVSAKLLWYPYAQHPPFNAKVAPLAAGREKCGRAHAKHPEQSPKHT